MMFVVMVRGEEDGDVCGGGDRGENELIFMIMVTLVMARMMMIVIRGLIMMRM